MAFKKVTCMDSWEIIRRWHNKQSIAHIARTLGFDRKTVRECIKFAKAKGLSVDQPLPDREVVQALFSDRVSILGRSAHAQTLLEPLLQEVLELLQHTEYPLKPKLAFEAIVERHYLTGKVSYSSFKRFIKLHALSAGVIPSTCRLEVLPGKEVQIDYGRLGILYDRVSQQRRVAYLFLATLSHSRHKYVEVVFSQDQMSFVSSHIRMFHAFGGVPERIVLDNLKSGVLKPDLYDPKINHSYRELADHYGCFIDPCRVQHPQDKGKVERDIQTLRQQARKLLVLYPDIEALELTEKLNLWCRQGYGQRPHGTTHLKPYQVFLETEQPALKPLPQEPFVLAQWKEVTVHPDHYIQFNKQSYSVPHPYVGKRLWVKATDTLVQVFHNHTLIKQHIRTKQYRHTDPNDFPPNLKAALDEGMPKHILQRADLIGPAFHQLIRSILEPHAFINLRKAQGLLGLTDHFPHTLAEQAARWLIDHHLTMTPKAFKQLLEKLQRQQHPIPLPGLSSQTLDFVREPGYFSKPHPQEIIQ
jgi:transposase